MASEVPELSSRQREMMRLVQREGFISVEAFARAFGMTPQTIRRDINQLCELGLLRRHHGGAGLPSTVVNADYGARQVLFLDEKRAIARLAAEHVPDGASLFINIGTTTEEVTRNLSQHKDLRIITNNLNVATIMSSNEASEVIVAGGVVRNRDRGVIGEATVDFIEQFRVDIAVIGISGIDMAGTLLDFDYREVRVAQAIVRNSSKVFLVADHSKFGRNALVRLGHLRDVDDLFTDRAPPAPIAALAERHEVRVHVATRA